MKKLLEDMEREAGITEIHRSESVRCYEERHWGPSHHPLLRKELDPEAQRRRFEKGRIKVRARTAS